MSLAGLFLFPGNWVAGSTWKLRKMIHSSKEAIMEGENGFLLILYEGELKPHFQNVYFKKCSGYVSVSLNGQLQVNLGMRGRGFLSLSLTVLQIGCLHLFYSKAW